jgi:cell division protein FtsB
MRFTEQQALAEIAKTGFTGREHSDRVLREAIKSNEDSRLVAVRLLGDQRMLAEVAKTATDEDVREAAVRRLRDQALLAEVAKTTHYLSAGREGLAAVKELNDQKLLAEIAETATSTTVREAAIKKLSDQRLLAEIAKAGKDKDPWLAGIAKTNNNSSVREAAVEKLSDQGVLAEVAKTDDSFFVREAAVDKLSDQGLLAEIAKTHTDRFLREAAARRSSDQGVLAQIARKTEDGDVGRKRLPIVQPASRSADNGPTSDLPDQQLLEKLQQLQKKHFQADPLTKGDSITELINNLIPKLAAVHGRDSARIFAVYHRSIGSPDLVILRACTSAEDLYHDLDALLEDYSVHVDDHYSVVADAENRIASIAVHNKGSASGRVMNVFVWREAKPLYRFIGQRGAFTDSTGLTVRRRGT